MRKAETEKIDFTLCHMVEAHTGTADAGPMPGRAPVRRRPAERGTRETIPMRRVQFSRQEAALRRKRELIRQKRRRQAILLRTAFVLGIAACICIFGVLCYQLYQLISPKEEEITLASGETVVIDVAPKKNIKKPVVTEDFLTPNEYSRPGEKLEKVKNIFVHYTANPSTSAAQNRSYFEQLGQTGETSASAHFVIGYEGEIIQCVPLEEIAYAVKGRNYDSVSIECCYVDADGKFTQETYDSLVKLSSWLLQEYGLNAGDMRRHYDEGGKNCPKYFVEHEGAWAQFIQDVNAYQSAGSEKAEGQQ